MNHLASWALASTLTVFSASALALEALEDDVLATTTGQDGVTLSLGSSTAATMIPFSTVIHDGNGITGATTPGALVIGRPLPAGDHIVSSITIPSGQFINVLLDATADVDTVLAGNQPALGINISIPSGTVLHTGTLSVARSNGGGVAITNQSNVIMNDLAITLGATTLSVTLGNEANNGQMMRLSTNMTSGLAVSNVAVRDVSAVGANGVAIRASSIQIDNAGASTALDADIKVDVIATGLQATVVSLGGAGGADIRINDMRLGDTASTSLGTLNISGLNVTGATLRIYGH